MKYVTLLPLIAFLVATSVACGSVPNRDPTGELFPTVNGQSLDRQPRVLPRDVAGESTFLLIGYERRTQFDIDRWAIGLVQMYTPVTAYEIPTVRGLVPSLISERIDNGMRSGIPSEDWGAVVTVYREADAIVSWTGNENGLNARVVLLDGEGRVIWFHDRGFSPGVLKELHTLVQSQRGG